MTKEEATWRCTHGWLRGEQCEICQSQSAQEPVAWIGDSPTRGNGKRLYWTKGEAYHYATKHYPLFTAPQRKEWVGLTETEIDEWTPEIHGVIRSIEAKLKEKNT